MNKLEWLLQLRRCQTLEKLERVIEYHKNTRGGEQEAFHSAADHRLAELTVDKIFDKIPASVWKFVK